MKLRLFDFVIATLIAILPVARGGAQCVVPPSGLVSWWAAEGDAHDSAGVADGVLLDGAGFAPGWVGQAFSFDGTNAYVRLPDNVFPMPPVTPANTAFSFETWFSTTTGGVILGQQTGVPFAYANGWVPSIYVGTDGKLRAEVFWAGTVSPVVSTQVVSDGVFHHVAVSYDGTNETVYLDSRLLSQRAQSQVAYGSSYSYQLGVGFTSSWEAGNGGWYAFRGLIDEPALYNRALSSNEVAAIYTAGTFGKCPNSLPPVITRQPGNSDGTVGSAVTLRIGLHGATPFAYQWQFYGTNLPGATSDALVLPNFAAALGGPYSVQITNAFGLAQSGTGIVTAVFPLVLDAVVSNGVPALGAGNLEAPGAQDVYSFEAPSNRVVYMGVLSAFNRLFWSLTAPDGSAVFTGRYMPNDDIRRLQLPVSGSYRLVVYNDSGITGAYGFRISSVTDQVFNVSLGTTVSNGIPVAGAGNLETSGSYDDYLFLSPSNNIVYFNALSAFNRLFWSLTAPDGTVVFRNYLPNNDVGRVQLPMAGLYRLRVYDDDQFTGPYSFSLSGDVDQVFNLAVGDTVTNGVPGLGAGNLEAAGTWDDYLFNAPANGLVFLDVLSSFVGLRWSLLAPDDSAIFSGSYMPNNDVGRRLLPQPGTYRLRVYNDRGVTGTYSFRLTGLTDQAFALNIGDTVTNGVPAAGAGAIETAGSYDDYVFSATNGQSAYFSVLAAPFRLFWTLIAPNGAAVFSGRYMPNNDVGRVDLPMAGMYHLRVYSDSDATGSYSFRLTPIVDQTFNLTVGAIVTNGAPVAGAGNLPTPGAYQDYLFDAPPNLAVYFDVLSAPYRLFWTLYAPDGSTPFTGAYMPNNSIGRVDLVLSGTYRLRVYSDSGATGPYSFRLASVTDQLFSIAIGSVVTNGIPVAGAGVLQSAGARDLYEFTGNAGQAVHFDDRGSAPQVAAWRLVAPGGARIFSANLNGSDSGTFTLPVSGTYNLSVWNQSDASPVFYSFALVASGSNSVPPVIADRFDIAIGDLISNGLPAVGAGNIETNGALDIYTFTSGVGQVVYFEERGGSPNGQLRYDVYDSQWNLLFGEWFFQDYWNHQAVGRQTLARGGAYYIVASGNNGTTTGTYSLKLWPVADQSFTLNIGDTVTTNAPGPGAGFLATPGERDTFTVTASPGQVVYFEDLGATPNGQIRYDVYGDRGTWLFGEWLYQDYWNHQAVGRQTLTRGGAYTIMVSGNGDSTGAYSFKVWPVADQSFALNVGETVSTNAPGPGAGVLATPGALGIFNFTATPGQVVYFEDLGATPNGQIRYDVYDERGAWLFGEWLYQDYWNHQGVGRQTLARGGTYSILVSANEDAIGTYSFKLWPEPADQHFSFNLGDTITNGAPAVGAGNIEVPGARDIYTFSAAPGQVVYFEDRGGTPNRQIRYDVFDERGVYLFGEWLGGDQEVGRQILTWGGTYTLIASAYADATGTYSFKVWPVTDQFFSLHIGDVITNGVPAPGAGNIETPGEHDIYDFTAAPQQLVYFEDRGASNNRNIRYDVYDPNWAWLFGEWLGNDQEVGLQRLSLGGTYHLVASGNWNSTGTYSLRIWDALPHILEQPIDVRGAVGQAQSFAVDVENPYPLSYQWQLYGTNLTGATAAILNVPNPGLAQAGPYDVIVNNSYGSVTSAVATLTLDPAEFYVTAFSPSGPVNTNVSQLRVQFNSAVLANSLTPAQIAITGPAGTLDSGSFTILPVDAQTFLVNIPAQSAEGAYTVAIGPAVTSQAGVPMTGRAFSPVYATDFESGAASVWSRADTISNAFSSEFLGEFANDTVTLYLAGLPPHSQLSLLWDSLIIDNWDGTLAGPDDFGFNLPGLTEPAWEYSFHSSGNPLVQSFPGSPDVRAVNFAGDSAPDSIYRNLRFDFPHTNDTLEIDFYGRNLRGLSYGGWGLDNVRVRTETAPNGVFSGRFVIDHTAPSVSSVTPSGTSLVPVSSLEVTFDEPIQPRTLTTNTALLLDPRGHLVTVASPVRLSATTYELDFPAQRTNGTYTLVVGPNVLDLAGNQMSSSATNVFNILTPPVITTPPADVTLLRNNTAIFSVVADATPPVQYQWDFNGTPIAGATDSTLTLTNVQTSQSGPYQVVVTDAGGSVTSAPVTLTVQETYGPFIAQAEAARSTVPAVPGNGVYIELYNGIGGSIPPSPDTVQGHTPDGTTLSPVVDFPHPGQTINVGNTFDSFFGDTTVPPDQVRGLQTSNFTLRVTTYLRVTKDLDLHPETPEIDLQFGVGSDDGFYLLAGTNFLGQSADRSFTYTWMPVSFQDEGLYPVTLYYDANNVGSSGLEFAWNTATSSGNQIIPESALYLSPDLGDRLITFEELPVGTVLANQYAPTGAVFKTISGAVQITTNFPTRFVPVSSPNVLADPNATPAQPGIVDISFVSPGTTNAATSDFVSFFLINAQNDAATVVAFDSANQVIFTNSYHGGGASQQLVTLNEHGIARVRVNLGQGTNTAAIDNLAFLTPESLPDLVVTQIQAPPNVVVGQPVQLIWQVRNQGFAVAQGPWTDTIALSPDGTPGNSQLLASVTYSNVLSAGAFLSVTQSVIVPGSQAGNRWFVITTDASHSFTESGSQTNNTRVASNPTSVAAPDLAVQSVSAPLSAQFGQAITVSWSVRNVGNANAGGQWNDRVLLGRNPNSLVDAISLLTVPAAGPQSPGGAYTNTQSVTLPLNGTLPPGNYYLLVQTDPDGAVPDPVLTNNLLAASLTLILPPLPDLAVSQVSSPGSAAAGQVVPVSWVVTNQGAATAIAPWRESVYMVPAALPLAEFMANPLSFPLVGAFTYTNNLAAGAAVSRNEQITIPLFGTAGDIRIVVLVDSDNNLIEENKANNGALAVNDLQVPITLVLSVPVTNVLENTPSPNLACLVSRDGDLTASVVVSLTSSATNHLEVPASVIIPAGAPGSPFTATVLDDGVFDPDVWVTLSASAAAYGSSTAQVLVVNTDLPQLGLTLASPQITKGQTVAATVTRATANSQPLVVAISSSSSTAISGPTSVTIPANSNSVTFVLLAVPNTVIEPTHVYSINASAGGFGSATTNLTVLDNNTPLLTLSLDRTNISEGDGPLAAIGTVSRTPVTDQHITVALASSNTAAALVPAQVTIPGLQSQATFSIAAVKDNIVTGPKPTLLSAQVLDALGNPVGVPATESLVVQDDDGPTLKLAIANHVVGKGLNPATTALVWRNTPPTNNLVVTLTSSATNEATVPPTVTIPAGQTNATVSIASRDDGVSMTSTSVTITAGAANYASGSDVLLVSDVGLPDLIIASINVPGSGLTGEPLTIGFRLANQGLGPLTNTVDQSVFLATDPASSSRVLVGTVAFGGPLAAGQYVDQSVLVPASAVTSPGTYWVMVTADSGGAATELNSANNTTIGSTPVVVSSEYTATIKAGLTNVVAGTPVPLSGSATLAGGGPAANKPVNILLTVRGLQRVFGVFTDTNGNFSTVFNPLPTEAGLYTVSAVPPGITNAPAQDQFSILGATVNPASLSLLVMEGGATAGAVTVQNLSELPLTGLTAIVNGLAANLTASAALSTNVLDSQGSLTLSCNISAQNATIRQSSFSIHLASAEGVTLDLPVSVVVQPLQARLASTPAQLGASMLRGAQTIVQFDVVNLGGAASGPLTLNLPNMPWLSAASTNPLPSLDPGQTNRLTLVLTPAPDLALGPYTGALTVNGSGPELAVPFTFTAVSDAHGALRVHSTDEYTYFAPGSPPLTNASLTLIEPFSRTTVASGFTDTNGIFFASNVIEGTYELDVTADKHVPFKGSVIVTAARTNDVEAFLSRQTVQFTWTVVPTQVQDVTHITILAEFEANVPAPVVVPTPTSLDLTPLDQPGKFMDVPLTLANYGLIAVQGVTISISTHPLYRFDLLTHDVGTLPAHGTVTVPMRVTRLPGPAGRTKLDGEPCAIDFHIGYYYICGNNDVSTGIPIPVFGVTGDCPAPTGGGTIVIVGGPGGGGGPFVIPPGMSSPGDCDQCMAKAILECAIGYTPVGCPYGVWSCVANGIAQGINASTAENCIQQGVGCLGPWGNTASCLWSFLRCKCPGDLSLNWAKSCVQNALGGPDEKFQRKDASVGLGLSPVDPRDVYAARSYFSLQLIRLLLGDTDGRWFPSGSGGALGAWFTGFTQSMQSNSPAGTLISSQEAASLLALPRPNTVSPADVQATIDRWNLTITNWRANIFSVTNVPHGGNTNFIDLYVMSDIMTNIGQQFAASQAAGFADPMAGYFAALQDAESKLGHGGVCARVVLELDQDAVLTRDAFRATLQLDDSSPDPLMNVGVNLVVRNQLGQDVTSLFGVEPPTLTGALTGVDGTGTLAPGTSGSAQWILLPTLDAAPQAPTNYLVSGSFSYVENGVTITIPLAPAPIKVQPSPELYVKYFHQRDVFADDPYTPQIEPSIPYSLAVMVQNEGYGIAHDFKITSAQPKIIDNQKGLLIDFKIIGAQVGNQPVAPTLTVDFGDIQPQQTAVGRWLLTSTLQGLFINYQATFQHVDPLGNPRLSLIRKVEIHEMNHLVQAEGGWDDGLPDFLVNDIPDFNNLPDTLYLSDGSKQPVSVVQNATTDGPASVSHLEVQFTANFPAGFVYVQVPDPANGQFPLTAVVRGNSTSFLTNNFWITDRTFPGLGQPPIHENVLHLFAYHTNAGPDTYTLVYAPPSSVPQTNPPVSAVFSLPAQSPPTFGVVWSGANYVGQASVAYYDIFVSDDAGPFTLWQRHTTSTGALYTGQYGHSYAFYSIATDTAGNVEAPPATPDAVTTVALSNSPPTISFSTNVTTVNEGDTVLLTPTVSDPNVPAETLTFTLLPGAPVGVVVDPATGLLSWTTGKGSGSTTNLLGDVVTDNGFPPLSATGFVTVIVKHVNSPPILAPINDYTINEGALLTITNVVTDYDIPPETFTFTLGAGAPAGASINPTNGIFTWRPAANQGPSTNLITVIVTDSGSPPLSDSQQFTVIVRHVLPDFTLGLGSTNVMTGESGVVPLTLASTLELTNLTFQLGAANPLTNLALQPILAEVTSATLQALGSNLYAANLTLNPALQVNASRALAQLAFLARSNAHSAIVPLTLSSLAAQKLTGETVSHAAAGNGRVIVVAAEPVVELTRGPALTLYGHPSAGYVLQYRTNLDTAPWLEFGRLTLTGRSSVETNLPSYSPIFYRAYELPLFGLSLSSFDGPAYGLTLRGLPGTHFRLQTATNLSQPIPWADLFSVTLSNSVETFNWTNFGEAQRLFRGVSP